MGSFSKYRIITSKAWTKAEQGITAICLQSRKRLYLFTFTV